MRSSRRCIVCITVPPNRTIAPAVARLLHENGISDPPVDLDRIARNLGVHVEYVRLADSLSGFLSTKGDERIIGVNARHHKTRQRFTMAHELAHVLLGHDTGEVHVDKGIVLFRDADSTGTNAEIEIEANRYAAELLVPRAMLKEDLSRLDAFDAITDDDLEHLANRYAISLVALLNRLGDIGFATTAARRAKTSSSSDLTSGVSVDDSLVAPS
jgi:Zn-dependent peptidase ImmA (M78 family)